MRISNSDSGLTEKRSNRLLTAVLTALCAVSAIALSAQDYTRLSERTIFGTARYMGMGGAMSAIGGDPSAAHDNIAGLGLYRRSEALITLGVMHERTYQRELDGNLRKRTSLHVPQASFVLSLPSLVAGSKVQFHNLMFSYRRLQTFSRTLSGVGAYDPSLGAQLALLDVPWDIPFDTRPVNDLNALLLSESGAVNEFDIAWAMNISDRWYVGLGLNVQAFSMSAEADYLETFYKPYAYIRNKTSLIHTGASCSLSAGMICRPTSWLRLGVGIQTPSLGAMNRYATGTLTALTDSVRSSYSPDVRERDSKFHMPMHLSTSVAFQIGAYGMIGLQYDLLYQNTDLPVHSLRAGLEVIPVLGFYLNAGYVYESTFNKNTPLVPMDPAFERQDTYFLYPRNTQYASFAIGYRGSQMIIQAAYQYRWQNINLYAHELAAPYDMHADTHRVVLTIGWHN